jgi:hypothetical protein
MASCWTKLNIPVTDTVLTMVDKVIPTQTQHTIPLHLIALLPAPDRFLKKKVITLQPNLGSFVKKVYFAISTNTLK